MRVPMWASRIREARKSADLRQEDLAGKLGFTQAAVSEWERGKSQPSGETYVQMARALHATTDYLLGATDDPAPSRPRNEDAPASRVELTQMAEALEGLARQIRSWLGEPSSERTEPKSEDTLTRAARDERNGASADRASAPAAGGFAS